MWAALVNGTLAHGLDFDDTHQESVVHVSAGVVPAALAAAEEVDADGERCSPPSASGWRAPCASAWWRAAAFTIAAFIRPGSAAPLRRR